MRVHHSAQKGGKEKEKEGRIVPVRQLEVTVGPGRRDYLTPASTIAPLLTSITLWCFESENVSSLSGIQFSSQQKSKIFTGRHYNHVEVISSDLFWS